MLELNFPFFCSIKKRISVGSGSTCIGCVKQYKNSVDNVNVWWEALRQDFNKNLKF